MSLSHYTPAFRDRMIARQFADGVPLESIAGTFDYKDVESVRRAVLRVDPKAQMTVRLAAPTEPAAKPLASHVLRSPAVRAKGIKWPVLERFTPHVMRPAVVTVTFHQRPPVRRFIAEYADRRGLTYETLVSKTQLRSVAWPRQDAMLAVREAYPWLSLPQIGRAFGGRDHTTCLWGIKRARARREAA